MNNKIFGTLVATGLAGMLVSAPAFANKKGGKAHVCENGCKGQNGSPECKGHAPYDAKSAKACKKAGGTWVAKADAPAPEAAAPAAPSEGEKK